MKRILILLVVTLVSAGFTGCWMESSPLLNPPTGPGSKDYPCKDGADWNYCGDHTCCAPDEECKWGPPRCTTTPFQGNNEWLGAHPGGQQILTTPRKPAQ